MLSRVIRASRTYASDLQVPLELKMQLSGIDIFRSSFKYIQVKVLGCQKNPDKSNITVLYVTCSFARYNPTGNRSRYILPVFQSIPDRIQIIYTSP